MFAENFSAAIDSAPARSPNVHFPTFPGPCQEGPCLLSGMTQVVAWGAMLALSGSGAGFMPTVVVWLKAVRVTKDFAGTWSLSSPPFLRPSGWGGLIGNWKLIGGDQGMVPASGHLVAWGQLTNHITTVDS